MYTKEKLNQIRASTIGIRNDLAMFGSVVVGDDAIFKLTNTTLELVDEVETLQDRVLKDTLIDDDSKIKELVKSQLEQNGFEVESVIEHVFKREENSVKHSMTFKTNDEDNDLIVYFTSRDQDGQISISDITVI